MEVMDKMKKTVSALKARKNLGQILEEVFYKGDQVIIERAGKPMAAMVPIWLLEQWQEQRDIFFELIAEVWQKNKKVPQEKIEEEVEEAVSSARKKTK